MINVTALEYDTLVGLVIYLALSTTIPLIYVLLRNRIRMRIPYLLTMFFILATGILLATSIFVRKYVLSNWEILLPNGTYITITHTSSYLVLADKYTLVTILVLIIDLWILAALLLYEIVVWLGKSIHR